MKTEAYKLYCRVFYIFLPNVIKVDPYNFALYCFKVCAFFSDTVYVYVQCVGLVHWHAGTEVMDVQFKSHIVIIIIITRSQWIVTRVINSASAETFTTRSSLCTRQL